MDSGGEILSSNGISGKVIQRHGDGRSHNGLPKYSNTSAVYFKLDDETRIIERARIYNDRHVAYDFDWGHDHKDYVAGVVHVHVWYLNKNGEWVRGSNPRLLNSDEINKYGDLLKMANSEVKFR